VGGYTGEHMVLYLQDTGRCPNLRPPPDEAEEALKEKLSKSRSPRNRRKIRERKIREAAEAMRKEMGVWAELVGTPADAWFDPARNEVLQRPEGDAFDIDSWFRFVQACRKDGMAMSSLSTTTPAVLERLGCETSAQRDAVKTLRSHRSPQPHPAILALVDQMRAAGYQPPPAEPTPGASGGGHLQPPVATF